MIPEGDGPLWLGDPDGDDPTRVGGKASSLSRLADRWPVPAGFCLTTATCRRLGELDDGPDVSRPLRGLLTPAYRELAIRVGRRRPPVAVRSSAVGEDGRTASFAGQHDTVLNAVGVAAVVDGVLACCRSLRSERAEAYRVSHDVEDAREMAVLVQHLVDAEVSAVVFSADPVTGDRERVVINATWGLGETLVAGRVTPDTYRLTRSPLEVTDRDVADKDIRTVRARRGIREEPVPPARRSVPALDADRCVELARLAIDLERHVGLPVDLECAYADRQLWLLQCRPITCLPDS